SLDTMAWAIGEGSKDLSPPSDDESALIEENDGPFKRDLDRYKYPNRYPDTDPLLHRTSGARFIEMLSDRLKETGRLSNGSSVFADIAIFPFIRQFRIADPAWFDQQDWPDLHRWLDQHMTSRAFIRCMMKYPVWKETGEETLFGAAEH
ncbi:MAG: glutathione S-transferase C-terminal domain-containing protein, partial [Pseudomonadota bacterium]